MAAEAKFSVEEEKQVVTSRKEEEEYDEGSTILCSPHYVAFDDSGHPKEDDQDEPSPPTVERLEESTPTGFGLEKKTTQKAVITQPDHRILKPHNHTTISPSSWCTKAHGFWLTSRDKTITLLIPIGLQDAKANLKGTKKPSELQQLSMPTKPLMPVQPSLPSKPSTPSTPMVL
ncbi:hypothetical protein NDU88_007353 [Pleurodeles waltl]|uniref:Uncharacterized protein n=1 Tax=Pleurodeles waltl TaxID=8319 RepID=A0AAV7UNK6_PLEWA|nr:hypothetical protein NDU88_007353 [Pleurodeles waltl]